MTVKISKKIVDKDTQEEISLKEISLKELVDIGKLDRIIYSTAGAYLGEGLEKIIIQKLEDLQCGDLYYLQEADEKKGIEEKKTPVCLWALDSRAQDWLSDKLSKENNNEEIYVIFGLTNSRAKSECENVNLDKQKYVGEICLKGQDPIIYPENYNKEYISQNRNSMAFLISDIFVAKENIDAVDIKKYYKAYFRDAESKQLNDVFNRVTYAYAEIEDVEGLKNYLDENQDTISDKETGVMIAKLIYPYVVSVRA